MEFLGNLFIDTLYACIPLVTQVLVAVTTVAIPALLGLVINYLRVRFKLNITAEQEYQLSNLALEGVKMASQKFSRQVKGGNTNASKLSAATRHLIDQAASIGVNVASDVAVNKVEAAVNQLKRDRGAI